MNRPTALSLLISVAALAAGCGGRQSSRTSTSPTPSSSQAASSPPPAPATPWPSAADYVTIRMAVVMRDRALFHQPDWRKKSFSASLALHTLLTVRIAPGRCATFVTQLYGNLLDLHEAYPGEDWRPLVQLVRREPSLTISCARAALRRQEPGGVPVLPGQRFGQLVA